MKLRTRTSETLQEKFEDSNKLGRTDIYKLKASDMRVCGLRVYLGPELSCLVWVMLPAYGILGIEEQFFGFI